MTGRAGVELTPTVVRLSYRPRYSREAGLTLEIPWDPTRPRDVIAALRARTGVPREITLSIGLGFLEVARVDLPPVPANERVRILELEPDRYFAAAREGMAATMLPDESVALGVPSSLVSSWIEAFETWAPVTWVEPAPVSIARTVRDGTYVVDSAPGENGLLQLQQGRIVSIRRMPASADLPDSRPLPSPFAAATGAALWNSSQATASALAPESWRSGRTSRRRMALAYSLVAAFAAVAFAVWSAERWRERTLDALQQRTAEVQQRNVAADSALRMLRSREAEAAHLQEARGTRPDPLLALAALSAALPREANVLSARANGHDWQIDGTTQDASLLVPLLDRHAMFDSVRFLTASSRYREANRSYETFSIAFRIRAKP